MKLVLLIHGLFGSLSDPEILSPFGDLQIFAPDLIGYGANRDSGPTGWTLEDQADHLAKWLLSADIGPVHVVGHSVGGAVGVLFAKRYPELTVSLTSVEGNLTLNDAFWSQKISTMELSEIQTEVDGYKADVSAWLRSAGVPATPWTLSAANAMLDNQPVATLRAHARAVVVATAAPSYLEVMRELLAGGLTIHLIAGARSRGDWQVPDWLLQGAASNTDIAETGHLMMLEKPDVFAQTVVANIVGPRTVVVGSGPK